jgi:hypothetical protein
MSESAQGFARPSPGTRRTQVQQDTFSPTKLHLRAEVACKSCVLKLRAKLTVAE